jgi:hypothetical protein
LGDLNLEPVPKNLPESFPALHPGQNLGLPVTEGVRIVVRGEGEHEGDVKENKVCNENACAQGDCPVHA